MACISIKKFIYFFPQTKKAVARCLRPTGYYRRGGASLPCSAWERACPPRHRRRLVSYPRSPGTARTPIYLINPTLPEHSMQRANICARQASRAIGAPRLCTSRCLRLASIHRVYFPGPFMEHVQRRTDPGAGFALRCSQRLSVPRAAARPWDWRPNRCTVASSPPVLAYWGGIP